MIKFGLPPRTTVFLASDLKRGTKDERVASFVRAYPRTVDLAALNLSATSEWAALIDPDGGGMTKGFASMILDQARCSSAEREREATTAPYTPCQQVAHPATPILTHSDPS